MSSETKISGGRPKKPSILHYAVNGERRNTDKDHLTVEEILRNAGAEACVDINDLDRYYLQNIVDGKEYPNLGDKVPIKAGDCFLAIYAGQTPIA